MGGWSSSLPQAFQALALPGPSAHPQTPQEEQGLEAQWEGGGSKVPQAFAFKGHCQSLLVIEKLSVYLIYQSLSFVTYKMTIKMPPCRVVMGFKWSKVCKAEQPLNIMCSRLIATLMAMCVVIYTPVCMCVCVYFYMWGASHHSKYGVLFKFSMFKTFVCWIKL